MNSPRSPFVSKLAFVVIQANVLSLFGCSDERIIEEHGERTYTIERNGQFTSSDYAVVHIYGFSGNE